MKWFQNVFSIVFLIAFFVLGLSLTSCKKNEGTNTGNPDLATNPTSGALIGIENLTLTMCNRIKSCDLISQTDACQAGILTAAGFTDELLLNPPYATLQDMKASYASGALQINENNWLSCTDTISNLACTDMLITSAFSSLAPTDFSKLYFLFRASASCQVLKK